MIAAAIIFIIGVGLVLNGWSIEARAETAMNQIYGAIYVVGGFVTVAIALATATASAGVSAIRKLRETMGSPATATDARKDQPAAAPAVPADAARSAPLSSYAICPGCGRENRVDARMCQCGTRLN